MCQCETLNHMCVMLNLLDLLELLVCFGTSLGCLAHSTLLFSLTGFKTESARE